MCICWMMCWQRWMPRWRPRSGNRPSAGRCWTAKPALWSPTLAGLCGLLATFPLAKLECRNIAEEIPVSPMQFLLVERSFVRMEDTALLYNVQALW